MSERVPFVDLARSHEPIRDELRAAIDGVVGRGDFILGEELGRFERDFAAYIGTEHAVGVGSGTAAITIALRACDIGPGDEVIVPAHTYVASAFGVIHAGAAPIFCDVDPESGLIDLESAQAQMSERTAAVLVVHLYGRMCDMAAIGTFAERNEIAVIEDAAQAHGAQWAGAKAGSLGRASAFSFYPSKNLGAMGDGGMICTNDSTVAEAARWHRNIGQRSKGEHVVVGFNERLDTLQAAVLRVKLRQLDSWNESRRAAAGHYQELLPDALGHGGRPAEATDVHHLFPIRVPDRGRVRAALLEAGVETGIHYSPAVHRHPALADPAGGVDYPGATGWAATQLSLPMFPGLTRDEVVRVCDALTAAL